MVPEARVAVMPPIVASAPGSIGKHQPGVAQGLRELQAGDARFDGDVEILRADAQDAVHLAQIEADPAAQRVHVPFERGAGAERDDRQLKTLRLIARSPRLRRSSGEADDVGRGWRW